jgi:hypothetical protein
MLTIGVRPMFQLSNKDLMAAMLTNRKYQQRLLLQE